MARKLFEITPEKQIAWTHCDGQKVGIHHFQILDTDGKKLSKADMK